MLERKNIDRVFQENLKDLDIYPSKKVWNNIELHLVEKTQGKTIPLWRRVSGIAMTIMLLVASGFWYFNLNSIDGNVENQVSDSNIENINDVINSIATPIVSISPENPQQKKVSKSIVSILKKEEPAFVKSPNNKVIITSTKITSIYETIENKYIVNQSDFLKSLKSEEILLSDINTMDLVQKELSPNNRKWSIGPTVAPVYYNSLQSGSPIDENLSNNSKSSENALSIGVKLNYQLTKKIKIQSGINKVELAYLTKNVSATTPTSKFATSNISSNSGIVLRNSGGQTSSLDSKGKSNLTGDLSQSLEYFELPIEMKYSLFESRFGIDLVGGFSTFILTNNSVSIVTQNQIVDIGKANNLNSVNFSGNFGVDFDYKINKNWYLNIAPMFKYQFNTYSNNSGNFQPYYFGVYSGLNYRF